MKGQGSFGHSGLLSKKCFNFPKLKKVLLLVSFLIYSEMVFFLITIPNLVPNDTELYSFLILLVSIQLHQIANKSCF